MAALSGGGAGTALRGLAGGWRCAPHCGVLAASPPRRARSGAAFAAVPTPELRLQRVRVSPSWDVAAARASLWLSSTFAHLGLLFAQ